MAKIITLIVLISAVVGALAASKNNNNKAANKRPELNKDQRQAMDGCKKSFPVDDSVMRTLHQTGALPDESNENARCHVQCLMTKIGPLMDANGNFDASAAKKNLLKQPVFFGPPGTKMPAQSKVDTVVGQCSSVTGEGKCMTSYKIWNCIYTKFHES